MLLAAELMFPMPVMPDSPLMLARAASCSCTMARGFMAAILDTGLVFMVLLLFIMELMGLLRS